MTNLIGRTIKDRYQLEALLGDGGMGTVYRAHDKTLGRTVAIKLMHSHFARQDEFRQRLLQEAQTAAQLSHPSIISIYDFGEDEVGLFIAMEYVDGGSLRDHLKRLQRMGKYLPLSQSLQIASQIADALHYAHNRGIIHRDVKPGNIILKRLVSEDVQNEQPFRAVLTDFGLVKVQEGLPITQSGTTLGTPTYMSPEQCRGSDVDGRSDLYALGVVLYELITNRLPFYFKNLNDALSAHNRGEMPTPARQLRPDVPPILEQILIKILSKEPDTRYQTGADFANALRSAGVALDGAPTQILSRQEISILGQVAEAPVGYDLQINTPGHPASVVPLSKPIINIGRNADNDIVLPTEGVSRHHARLQATLMGWELVDLGGINGTWLNDMRLRENVAAPVPIGAILRMGPYEMVFNGPQIGSQADVPAPPPQTSLQVAPVLPVQEVQEQETAKEIREPAVDPLALFLLRDQLSVSAGERVIFKVEVVNRGEVNDRVNVRVQGLPADWVSAPDEFTDLPAGETIQLSIGVRPPRHRRTPTGRQRFRLELVSQQHPKLKIATSASLQIEGFHAFEAKLDPERVTVPGTVLVNVRNTGNLPAEFSVTTRQRLDGLHFAGEKGRLRLDAGQAINVPLDVEAKKGTSFSTQSRTYSFEVHVRARQAGGHKELVGKALVKRTIPQWAIYIGYVLVFVAVLMLGIAAFTAFDRQRDGNATPTATLVVGLPLTETAVAVVGGTETAVALGTVPPVTPSSTPAPVGDADGDGVSDSQEAIFGSNPNNPDSDGDGLSDGDEVFIYGTGPAKRDSDGDLLTDGDEIFVFGTDPLNEDTDGDGVWDGDEVEQGSNPLAGPTATSLPVTPSDTPTAGPTPIPSETPTATLLPTITNTPPPEATATLTPTATQPPTDTATPTEPAPTEIPTETLVPTITTTPIVAPQLSCSDTPPTVDGVFNEGEWTSLLYTFTSDAGSPVDVYATRGSDPDTIYFAFLVGDSSRDITDSVRFYMDVTNNGGDPDATDRFFQIVRDGTLEVQSGLGDNVDGDIWDATYEGEGWQVLIGEPNNGRWVIEMSLDVQAQFPDLNPQMFGVMTQVLFTGEALVTWPAGSISNDPTTWQDILNVSCE